MPNLHDLACIDGQRRHARGRNLRHQRLDALGDGDAVLVELVLPQEAVHQRALQLQLGRETLGPGALMGEGANDLVDADHDGLLLGLLIMDWKRAPGNRRGCTALAGVTCSTTELRTYRPEGLSPPTLRLRSNSPLHHL